MIALTGHLQEQQPKPRLPVAVARLWVQILILCFLCSIPTAASARYAVNNGNWNDPNTWNATNCFGAGGAAIPTAATDVVICNDHTVTLTAPAAARSLLLEAGNKDVNLNHNAGVLLTVGAGGVIVDGASNGNTTKTWNIGAGSAVVNGPVLVDGGSNQNRIARILLSTGSLDVNGDLTMNATINPYRAVIEATGAANISLSGNFSIPGGMARILPGTASTFTYDGTGSQTALLGVSEINYYNLVFAGSGTKNQTTWATPTIPGTTTVNSGVTFNNSASVIYQGNFVNAGTTNAGASHQYQGNYINSGTYSALNTAQEYWGNFNNSGTFNSGSGFSHTFNGTSAQQLTGATTFTNMAVNNPAGLTINSNVTVREQLALTNGVLTTGTNVLRVAQAGGWSGISRGAGWVAGNLGLWMPTGNQSRTFDIGGPTVYRPLTLSFPSVTTAGYVVASISQASGDHPNIGSSDLDASRSVNRWWSITSEGAAVTSMDAVFNYVAADIDPGATPGNFNIRRYSAGWAEVTRGSVTAAASQGTGIIGFGQFAIAEISQSTPICVTLASGIVGQYFNNMSLAGTAAGVRTDGPIDFDWVDAAPGVTGVNADQFSARWEGLIRVTQSGNYRFQTLSDDGVRLWVNGQLIINNWTEHSVTTDTSIQVALVAGETYTIKLEFYENGGQAVMRLRWQLPGSASYVAIPAGPSPTLGAGLYRCQDSEICTGITPGAGMEGEYFNNTSLTGTATGKRVDGPIDFGWNLAAPGVAGINVDGFSVRWMGRLRAAVTGNYQFQTHSDDGVRLWVNDILLIDQWNDHTATNHTSVNLNLLAGQVYAIRLEYYDRTAAAEIRLRWLVPGTGAFVPIPAGPTPVPGAGLYHCPAAPTVSFYTIAHSGTGITCEAAPVLVTAMDSTGTPVAPPANTTVVLATVPATGVWVGGNTYVFSGTETAFIKYLQQLTPAALNINLSDGTASEIASADPNIVFSDAGLRFYGDASLIPLPNQVAGITDANPVLRAVQTNSDTGACEARVAGSQTVRLAYECRNPASCIAGQVLTLGGVAAASNNDGNVTAFADVALNFNVNGLASIPINYTDVGRLRLHAQLNLPANGNDPAVNLIGSSNEFVVKPYTLAVSAVSGNPGTTSGGAGFIAAGENFSVAIQARNFSGAATPNFGNEAISERANIALTIGELVYPAGGNTGTLTTTGTFTATTPAGTMVNNAISWNEVGSINLIPTLSDGDYLGAGDLVTPTTSGTVGRFYPHHFTLTSSSVENSCNGFSYMNHPAMKVEYQLEAQSLTNSLTTNYSSPGYAGAATIVSVAENADDGINLGARVSLANPGWLNGLIAVNASDAFFMRQASSAPDGPFANLQLGIGLTDTLDNRQLTGMDMNASTPGVCSGVGCNAIKLGTPIDSRFGRLRLADAFGPETVNLPVSFTTEYWNGSFFTASAGDTWSSLMNPNCTQIPRAAITYPAGSLTNDANRTVTLNGGSTQGIYSNLSPAGVGFTAGNAGHYFTAPGAGTGSFVVGVDLTNLAWLRFDWDQNGDHNNDLALPAANLGFGQYRGHDRVIYWREDLQ